VRAEAEEQEFVMVETTSENREISMEKMLAENAAASKIESNRESVRRERLVGTGHVAAGERS